MINDKFVQVSGPFIENEDIVNKIKKNYPDFNYIKRLGVQSKITHLCVIDGIEFEIGKTEILEFEDVQITSLFFKQSEPSSTIIDCVLG